MDFLIAFTAFLVAIGVLVTIHELGHFWVAKKLGIKVLRFSIGFGKVLKSWQYGETEWTLCALPLGGFVKMLDEKHNEVGEHEKHRAFNQQTVYKRSAVVIAGPAANFIFAIIAYTLIFLLGTTGIKPVVGNIQNNSIAQNAGLQTGDQLLKMNGNETATIGEFTTNFIQSLTKERIQLEVLSATKIHKKISLTVGSDFFKTANQSIKDFLGFEFEMPKIAPIINRVLDKSPAENAGLRSNDKIISADGQQIETWIQFVQLVQNNTQSPIALIIERNKQIIALNITPENKKIGVSVLLTENDLNNWRVTVKKDPLDAFLSANQKVYQLTKLNLLVIKKMIFGQASLKQISGPIGIANYAGKTAQISGVAFLSFLALISIGLGLLNLLPIPLLDGGHLFFYAIEILKGSPISETTEQILTKIGLLFILIITLIALYNDFSRLLT